MALILKKNYREQKFIKENLLIEKKGTGRKKQTTFW